MGPIAQYYMARDDQYETDLVAILKPYLGEDRPLIDVLDCGNDRAAFVAYQILLARGLRIPQDVAVLGFDNLVGVGHLFLPSLTTVQLPHETLGREAALHIIEGRQTRGPQRIPCPLLIRESA